MALYVPLHHFATLLMSCPTISPTVPQIEKEEKDLEKDSPREGPSRKESAVLNTLGKAQVSIGPDDRHWCMRYSHSGRVAPQSGWPTRFLLSQFASHAIASLPIKPS